MKEIYVHIGTHKTGTTALQQFFAINQSLLKKKGIEYPYVDGVLKAAHRRLVMTFYPNGMAPYCVPIPDVKDPLQEWRTALKLTKENKTLISSEHFFTCPSEIISQIRDITSPYKVKVICYIRRQDELEDSWYNQSVKGFRRSSSLPMATHQYDTQKYFSDWENIFGTENMLVRPYEKKQFYKNNIFSDFLFHSFGIELTDEFVLPKKQENFRFHRIALEYKRLINCLSFSDEQDEMFNRTLKDISNNFFKMGRKDGSVFSAEKRIQLLKENQSFYEELAYKYLAKKNGLFFSDNPNISKDNWTSYKLTKNDARYINVYIAKFNIVAFQILLQGIMKGICSEKEREKKAAILLLPGIFNFFTLKRSLLENKGRRTIKMICKLMLIMIKKGLFPEIISKLP